jgi:hypothetical protein
LFRVNAEGVGTTADLKLPADLMELIGRSNPHWAGNLNVFVGGRSVERHLAQALRIYPGRVNAAMFVVGSGPDRYRFALAGDGAAWDAALYNLEGAALLTDSVYRRKPIALQEWIGVDRQGLMVLALLPPHACSQGMVKVQVEQGSTGQTAVVEFSLDPSAAGPGCYVVS